MIYSFKDQPIRVVNPATVAKICQDLLAHDDAIDQDKEHFWAIHLDTRNFIKFVELVSLGTLNSSLVHPREVFTRAVGERSCQLIIVHNHPSGATDPSEDDILLTGRLRDAGKLLGIEIIDHLIISKSGFISFKQESLF